MTTNSGNPNVTPAPAIHNVPATGNQGLAIAGELEAAAQFIIEGFIGQVLIAFGGINIAGFTPFALLSQLGQALVAQANSAYLTANTAQSTATTANTKSDDIIDAIVGGLTSSSSTGNPVDVLTGLFQGVQSGIQGAVNQAAQAFSIVTQFGSVIQTVIEDLEESPIYVDAEDFLNNAGAAAANLVTTALQTEANLIASFENMFLSWFGHGSTPTSTPADVTVTIAAIKSAVVNGYTVKIFTTSNHAWPIPADLADTADVTGIVINGGGMGGVGGSGRSGNGGALGSSGGYLSSVLDLTGLTPGTDTLDVTVGVAATTPGTNGGQSSIVATTGTLLAGAPDANGLATKEGLIFTTSKPGRGGVGASASGATLGTAATAGEDSGVALGGAAGVSASGTGGTGGNGGNGGAGDSSSIPLCGGAGGAGGGAYATSNSIGSAIGGNGGNGGYPGGGSGGGGAGTSTPVTSTTAGGNGGIPGNGLVALIYK